MDDCGFEVRMKGLAMECVASGDKLRKKFRLVAWTAFSVAWLFLLAGIILSIFGTWWHGLVLACGSFFFSILAQDNFRQGDRALNDFLRLRESILDDIERLRFH